jgi:two-component system, chemotaxis family, chemotaxis protein CheY
MADVSDIVSKLSVVVVDDNRNFLKLVRSILRNFGIKDCTVFDDPTGALSYLEIHSVDCVLTDLVMPKMNGFELANKIRHSTVIPNRLLPIIMVTGHANRENIKKAIASGIDEVLVKPFRPTELQRRLTAIAANPRRYIRTEGGEATDQPRGAGATAPGPEQRAAAAVQAVRRRAEVLRRTGSYFDKPAQPTDGPQAPSAAPPRSRDVEQSDIYTIRRDSNGTEGKASRNNAPVWEI